MQPQSRRYNILGYPNGVASFTGFVVIAMRSIIIGCFIAENNKAGSALNVQVFSSATASENKKRPANKIVRTANNEKYRLLIASSLLLRGFAAVIFRYFPFFKINSLKTT